MLVYLAVVHVSSLLNYCIARDLAKWFFSYTQYFGCQMVSVILKV